MLVVVRDHLRCLARQWRLAESHLLFLAPFLCFVEVYEFYHTLSVLIDVCRALEHAFVFLSLSLLIPSDFIAG